LKGHGICGRRSCQWWISLQCFWQPSWFLQ
jgi:hypothetical protein